jgi:hypothetical protein
MMWNLNCVIGCADQFSMFHICLQDELWWGSSLASNSV